MKFKKKLQVFYHLDIDIDMKRFRKIFNFRSTLNSIMPFYPGPGVVMLFNLQHL